MDTQTSTIVFSPKTMPAAVSARICLILLNSDEVGMRLQAADASDVAMYTTRTAYSHAGGGFTMLTSFTEIADTLPPGNRFDVLAFSCTSATVALGIPTLLRELEPACSGVNYTSPAMIEALKHVDAKRLALLTSTDSNSCPSPCTLRAGTWYSGTVQHSGHGLARPRVRRICGTDYRLRPATCRAAGLKRARAFRIACDRRQPSPS